MTIQTGYLHHDSTPKRCCASAGSPEIRDARDQFQASAELEGVVEKMAVRDDLVRRHEEAHLNAAGRHAVGGIHYDFQTGPDGRAYRVGGHVKIDTAPVTGDPQATVEKMRIVREAALAPQSFDELSLADLAVADQATHHESQALHELYERQAMTSKVLFQVA